MTEDFRQLVFTLEKLTQVLAEISTKMGQGVVAGVGGGAESVVSNVSAEVETAEKKERKKKEKDWGQKDVTDLPYVGPAIKAIGGEVKDVAGLAQAMPIAPEMLNAMTSSITTGFTILARELTAPLTQTLQNIGNDLTRATMAQVEAVFEPRKSTAKLAGEMAMAGKPLSTQEIEQVFIAESEANRRRAAGVSAAQETMTGVATHVTQGVLDWASFDAWNYNKDVAFMRQLASNRKIQGE